MVTPYCLVNCYCCCCFINISDLSFSTSFVFGQHLPECFDYRFGKCIVQCLFHSIFFHLFVFLNNFWPENHILEWKISSFLQFFIIRPVTDCHCFGFFVFPNNFRLVYGLHLFYEIFIANYPIFFQIFPKKKSLLLKF